MKFDNYMILEFPSRSCNEAFARSAVSCFAAQLDPTMEELGDIRRLYSSLGDINTFTINVRYNPQKYKF